MRALAAALLLALAGCGSDKPRGYDKGVYTHLSLALADNLDPATSSDSNASLVILNVYEPLFAYDGASVDAVVPRLARTLPTVENGLISSDGRTYRVPIRDGVRFHDGTPLTPEDVRYSLLRFMLTDAAGGPSPALLEPLTGRATTRDASGRPDPVVFDLAAKAVTVDGADVVLRLAAPHPALLKVLTRHTVIVSKAWAVSHGAWDGESRTWTKFNDPKKDASPFRLQANGTGPFKLERYDLDAKEAVLARNDAYWRKPARLRKVVLRAVEDFAARKLLLQSGDADSITSEQHQREQLAAIPGVDILDGLPAMAANPLIAFTFDADPAGGYMGSGALDGNGVPPGFFADKDVREGFAHALDYDGYVRDLMPGGARAAGFLPPGLLGHDPSIPAREYDLEKARAHLQKAFGGKLWARGFRLALAYNAGNSQREIACRILARSLAALNPKFQLEVRPVPWAQLLRQRQASQVPFVVSGISADYADPHYFAFALMHPSGDNASWQRYRNPKAAALVEKALAEQDPAARGRLYGELQRLAAEDLPHIVIGTSTRFRAQRSWVKGFTHNPMIPAAPYGAYYYSLWKE